MRTYILIFFFCFLFQANYAQFGTSQLIDEQTFQISVVHASDLDGDNDLDVLILGQNADTVAWYENLDGLGNFGTINYISQTLFFTQSLTTADFDGDGDMDVLASSRGDDKVVWYENLDGLGTFSNEIIINDNAPFVKRVVAADIDNDNDMDVVAAITNASKVVWYENINGLGVFGDENIVSNNTIGVYELDVADINGDNTMDVIANSSSVANPSWYENLDGQGTFGTEQIIDTDNTLKLVPADIDGDGDMDIFKREINGDDNVFTWHENTDGLGTFIERQVVSTFYLGRELFAADMDNDDDIDLLAGYVGDGKIAWFENLDGLGTFGERQIIDNFASISIEGVDIDGDGYKDVLAQNNNLYNLVWYKNLMYLGVDDSKLEQIIIYPNPVSNTLIINNKFNIQIKSIKIYDVLGRLVLQKKENFNTLDVSQLTSGLLFVKLETAEGILTKKVVKE